MSDGSKPIEWAAIAEWLGRVVLGIAILGMTYIAIAVTIVILGTFEFRSRAADVFADSSDGIKPAELYVFIASYGRLRTLLKEVRAGNEHRAMAADRIQEMSAINERRFAEIVELRDFILRRHKMVLKDLNENAESPDLQTDDWTLKKLTRKHVPGLIDYLHRYDLHLSMIHRDGQLIKRLAGDADGWEVSTQCGGKGGMNEVLVQSLMLRIKVISAAEVLPPEEAKVTKEAKVGLLCQAVAAIRYHLRHVRQNIDIAQSNKALIASFIAVQDANNRELRERLVQLKLVDESKRVPDSDIRKIDVIVAQADTLEAFSNRALMRWLLPWLPGFNTFMLLPSSVLNLLLAAAMGLVGGIAATVQQYIRRATGETVDTGRIPVTQYFFTPVFGALVAVLLLIAIKATHSGYSGLGGQSGVGADVNPYILSFIALGAGLSSMKVMAALGRWFDQKMPQDAGGAGGNISTGASPAPTTAAGATPAAASKAAAS